MKKIKIGKKVISNSNPTYFIADIASNHDGSLTKAKELIHLAAESGADAAAKHMTTSSVARCSMGLQYLVRSMSSGTSAFVSTYLGKRGALGSAVPHCGGPARGHLAAVRHIVGRAVYAAQISGSTR